MQTIFYLILALIALVLGLNIMNWCLAKPSNMIYLAAVVYVYEVLSHLFSFSIDLVRFGALRLGPTDAIYILMLLMVIIKTVKHHMGVYRSLLYGVYCMMQILFFVSVLRGLMTYGFTSDTSVDFRRYYNFLIPIMFMIRFRIDFNDQKVKQFINRFMMVVLVFCYSMWAIILLTGLRLQTATNEGGTFLRIFGPDTTLVLVTYALYCLEDDLKIKGRISNKTMFTVLAVIIMQQRTVWVCFAVGLFFIFMNYREIGNRKKALIVSKRFFLQCLALIVVVIGIFIVSPQSGIMGDLSNSLASFSNLDEGTFGYRTMLWQGHLSTLKGLNAVIGKPFGAGYSITLASAGYSRVISAHNGYIMVALRAGYLGVLFFVWMLIQLMIDGIKQKKLDVLIFSAMMVAYFVGYSFDWFIGMGIGYCLRRIVIDNESISA